MLIQSEVRDQMFVHISQWQQSDLSQKTYCQHQSIKYHVFHYWYKRYREEHGCTNSDATGFIKLRVGKPDSVSTAEIHFPNGIRLLFHEPVSSNYLKALVS